MHCIVTAGPTVEPLDQVRGLTNASTGRLGTELAGHLADLGHRVTLFLGRRATWAGPRRADRIILFDSADDLRRKLQAGARRTVGAVFHAAAVSDFAFGRIWRRAASGRLRPVRAPKIMTRQGCLLAELRPTPKLISCLRSWFPEAFLVGWKYEVEGHRSRVIARARRQLVENLTDLCVANGPAYGRGFGLVTSERRVVHLKDADSLYEALAAFLNQSTKSRRPSSMLTFGS